MSPAPGGNGAGPGGREKRKAGTPRAGKACKPRRLTIALVPLCWRATNHQLQPALQTVLPPLRSPGSLLHRSIKPSGSFAGVLPHRSGRPSHQAILCQQPQESKCTAFPAKTCLRHAVAKAHTFAVKRAGARCPIAGQQRSDFSRPTEQGPLLILAGALM